MPEPLPPKTLAWLHQSAAGDRALLQRLHAIELAAHPTPEAAPVATDEDLYQLAYSLPVSTEQGRHRRCYNLGRQHGAAQPPTPQPAPPVAPVGGLVERVAAAIGAGSYGNWLPEARAAIREVAAWMRENGVGYNAIHWLKQEADR